MSIYIYYTPTSLSTIIKNENNYDKYSISFKGITMI